MRCQFPSAQLAAPCTPPNFTSLAPSNPMNTANDKPSAQRKSRFSLRLHSPSPSEIIIISKSLRDPLLLHRAVTKTAATTAEPALPFLVLQVPTPSFVLLSSCSFLLAPSFFRFLFLFFLYFPFFNEGANSFFFAATTYQSNPKGPSSTKKPTTKTNKNPQPKTANPSRVLRRAESLRASYGRRLTSSASEHERSTSRSGWEKVAEASGSN